MKIDEVFSLVRNGASIKQTDGASGIPITRIETISNRDINRDKLGYADVFEIGKYEDYVLQDGDILMSHINSVQHLGKTAIYMQQGNEQIIHGMNLLMLRPRQELVLPAYAYIALNSQKFLRQIPRITKKSVNQASFSISELRELEIDVPSLAEQGEIVARLDGVEALLANRHAALTALDTLVKSRFQSQFGDLRTNSMHWPRKPFTECALIESNMVHDFTNYADYPHIGIDSIEKNTGALKGYRTIGEDGVISGKYLFTDKHIIYSKIRPNLNKVALPDFEGLCSADAYAILPQEDICNRVYLCHVMRSPVFLNYILPFSSRTNMPKVNRKQVEGFTVPLPPIEEQNKFAAFVAEVERLRAQLTAAITRLTTLRAACMQHYFH